MQIIITTTIIIIITLILISSSLEEMPPDMHRPTPRPSKSIFHEMMVSLLKFDQSASFFVHFVNFCKQGDNTLSNLAMHSTHLLMKGVKDTMDFTKDFFNPFQV